MKRIHWFEFCDQRWLPGFLRDGITDYLCAAYAATRLPVIWAERISGVLRASGCCRLVDLGSGSAGPVSLVLRELRREGHAVTVVLTDLYPRESRPAEGVEYWPEPVDACAVPERLGGARTMFAAFHHLAPEHARGVLASAAARGEPICIFEATARSAPAIATCLLIPLCVLLLTPAIRPVKPWSMVFTYLIPLLPAMIFWDGLVSHLRTYTPGELQAMADGLGGEGYRWEAGELRPPKSPVGLPYLLGSPAEVCLRPGPGREVHCGGEALEATIRTERVEEGIDVE